MQVDIVNESLGKPFTITNSNFRYLYWNVKQQLVHHTVTGCNMRAGDLLGSGTISGPVRRCAVRFSERGAGRTQPRDA